MFRGTWQGTHVAVKVLSCRLTGELEKDFRSELETMLKLQGCPQLVRLFGAVMEGASQMMVMELMPKGNLNDLLRRQKSLDWGSKYKIALDVAYGLKYLHDRNILHRDLKSLNVLLNEKGGAKIADFGLAKIKGASKSHATTKQSSVGTLLWMAPELLGLRVKFANASDIYALGMVLYEMLVHHFPFEAELEGRDAMILLPEIKQGTRPELPSDGPEAFKKLIERCWTQVPTDRPMSSAVIDQLSVLFKAQSNDGELSQWASGMRLNDGAQGNMGRKRNLGGPVVNSRDIDSGGYGDSAVHTDVNTFNPEGGESMLHSHSMFKAPAPSLNQSEVNEFLNHVALGAQDKAEAMLKKTPGLVLGKGACTDHAGRTFKEISGFQYALWALDWHMWDMILPYFDQVPEGKTSASEQCESQERLTQQCGHGSHYSMQPLLNALQTYIDQYPALQNNVDQLARLWIHGVGKAQAQTVAHVAQEYCNPDRSFDPVPDFNAKPFKREFNTDEGVWWTATYNGGKLGGNSVSYTGEGFAVHRGRAGVGRGRGAWLSVEWGQAVVGGRDRLAIDRLCRVRTDQLSELKSSLSIPSPGNRR